MRIGSVCTGYGGLDMAVQTAIPADLVFVADPDPGAAKILAHHHPDVPNLGDITQIDWPTVEPVDILTAGYPCQPFSSAGLRKGTKDDRHIWPHIAHALGVLRPRLVVLENVRGHLGRGFDTVLADLARLGFDAEWATLAAADVGAAHRRERLFIIAWPQGARPPAAGAGGAGVVVPDGMMLLPTPRTSDTNGPGHHGEGGLDLRTAVSLLPTPAARDWRSGQSNILDRNARPLNEVIENLLPTPRASDGTKGGPNQRGSKGDLMLSAAVQPGRWGDYAEAVSRWARVVGRSAPDPVVPSGKGGRSRLDPVFTEWLMGLPEGHVTSPQVGLTRTQQLHALGNGVVPRQGAAALRLLLERVAAEVAA